MKRVHVTACIALSLSITFPATGFSSTKGLAIKAVTPVNKNGPYYGVNLAGPGFGNNKLPGRYGYNYIYPKTSEMDYFIEKGMNVFRLTFRWERIQHSLKSDLDQAELQRLTAAVDYATTKGTSVILDIHNYARYHGQVVGGDSVSFDDLADVWRKLASHFKHNPAVIIGLMNEPHGMPTEQWRDAANVAIAAIRDAGSEHLILVPGNGYSGGHSWYSDWYGTPNATVMATIVDPADNIAFEIHQYFDSNSSGTSFDCVDTEVGSRRLAKVTQWMRDHGQRAFLGEFGAADNPTCMAALDNTLAYIDANQDVWLGWTWWAAGAWWGSYPFSISPKSGQDKPQMAVLEQYTQQLN
jgi:endoglucanase